MVSQNARIIIWCHECGKPRLVYSTKALNDRNNDALDRGFEDFIFTCGGPILADDHHLKEMCFVNKGLTCKKAISSTYYSLGDKLDGFRMICFNCLEEGDIAVEDPDEIAKY